MKFILFITLLISFNSLASDYIVKVKTGAKLNTKSNLIRLNTSFGDFYKLSGDQKSDLKNLKNDPAVLYIEPNYTYQISPIEVSQKSTEPSFDKQWGLLNTGANSGGYFSAGIAGRDINAVNAWKITTGSDEVKIAVIDTGVDFTHPDLKNNIWVNEAEQNGKAGVDDDNNGYVDDIHGYDFANKDGNPIDDHGHGTHCAGIIGASHNGIGVAGVMSNVKIVALKFLTGSGSGTTEDAILAIDYAIKAGVDVMSNSWGGGDESLALKDAILAANEAGIFFVAAAGNESNNNDTTASFPANYKIDNVISVGSMDGRGKRSSFSNYGANSVHVFAPGSNIYSTFKSNSYKSLSGTSMACPFVSGILGLLKSHDSYLSILEGKERLINNSVSSTDLQSSVAKGWVDAFKALNN
ncbi:MAG: hypothetical protein A2202_02620 [Bdellovibrionales bacterium RIFOXYA1_FULL_36_14]|nr:MAG: hypothetical protein A2202_02620 [Bdellovibrionales bacterium RIFOXYA1_FULL_36_14]